MIAKTIFTRAGIYYYLHTKRGDLVEFSSEKKVLFSNRGYNWLLTLLVVLTISILNLIWLKNYPPVAVDEGSQTSIALNLFDSSKNINRIGVDVIDKLNKGSLIMSLLLQASFAVGGVTLSAGRVMMWLSGILLLILIFVLTRYLYDSKTALLSLVLLAVSEIFFFTSHLIRGDLPLAVMVLLSFFLLVKGINENKNIFFFLSGITIGFGFEAHPNALLFALAMGVMILINQRLRFWENLHFPLFVMGGLCFVAFYIFFWWLPNSKDWHVIIKFANTQDHPVPIFFYGLVDMFVNEYHRYKDYFFHKSLITLALILSIVFLSFRSEKKDLFILHFLVVVFLLFTLLSSNKDIKYLISIYPFLCILLSRSFYSLLERKSRKLKIWLLRLAILIVVVANLTTLYNRITRYKSHDYDAIIARIEALIPKDSKILAMPTYWIGLNNHDFISSYTLTYYHLVYKDRILAAMEKIKPDIIIIDSLQRQLFVDNGFYGDKHIGSGSMYRLPKAEVEEFLALKTELLGKIPDAFYGEIEIYKVKL